MAAGWYDVAVRQPYPLCAVKAMHGGGLAAGVAEGGVTPAPMVESPVDTDMYHRYKPRNAGAAVGVIAVVWWRRPLTIRNDGRSELSGAAENQKGRIPALN